MTDDAEADLVVAARGLCKTFRRESGETARALDAVDFDAAPGTLSAVIGPDAAGKTTLLRLICGLLAPDDGDLRVLGVDVSKQPDEVQARVAYMPQRFGLYDDLSVRENLDLYCDLHGVTGAARTERQAELLRTTSLGAFVDRPAGKLSGGMKQKLGLACTLVRSPELLLLDEPTAGVDPPARRELWRIILDLVRDEGLSVVVATSYLDEADRCDRALVLRTGRVLANGDPGEVTHLAAGRVFRVAPGAAESARGLQARLYVEADVVDAVPEAGEVRVVASSPTARLRAIEGADAAPAKPRFEDGFMILVRQAGGARHAPTDMRLDRAPAADDDGPVVEVRGLTRRFGDFTAVDDVTFEVRRGEVFGLLGPNGAGKTTTFRMLCGLLPATNGELRVAGVDLRGAPAAARRKIGYVAQKFSLYGPLSVTENLEFFAGVCGLRGALRDERIRRAIEQFELSRFAKLPSAQLPGGFQRRLSMAAALLHEPEILFLDEPTSGADPLARREFWLRITALAEQRVTVIVTTHFMEEAEYCDRLAILDSGRVLAHGTPADIRRRAPRGHGEATMESAFVAIVEEGRSEPSSAAGAA